MLYGTAYHNFTIYAVSTSTPSHPFLLVQFLAISPPSRIPIEDYCYQSWIRKPSMLSATVTKRLFERPLGLESTGSSSLHSSGSLIRSLIRPLIRDEIVGSRNDRWCKCTCRDKNWEKLQFFEGVMDRWAKERNWEHGSAWSTTVSVRQKVLSYD